MIRKLPQGLTIVEILAALTVLVIGLASITSILLGSVRMNRSAIERNAAAMIIAEAIPEIERRHLVTERMRRKGQPDLTLKDTSATPSPLNEVKESEIGLFIETLNNPDLPSIHEPRFTNVRIGDLNAAHSDTFQALCFKDMAPETVNMSIWPMPYTPAPVQEPPRTYGSLQILNKQDQSPHGAPLRVLYRLERHPEWHPHYIPSLNDPRGQPVTEFGKAFYDSEIVDSPYRGMYVLTLTVYKDSARNTKSLEQVSDPYVVYLRDKKVRQ